MTLQKIKAIEHNLKDLSAYDSQNRKRKQNNKDSGGRYIKSVGKAGRETSGDKHRSAGKKRQRGSKLSNKQELKSKR